MPLSEINVSSRIYISGVLNDPISLKNLSLSYRLTREPQLNMRQVNGQSAEPARSGGAAETKQNKTQSRFFKLCSVPDVTYYEVHSGIRHFIS